VPATPHATSPATGPVERGDPRVFGALAVLVLLVFAAYSATFSHDFVIYDDPVYISENAQVSAGLTRESASWAFGFHASNWHPLTWLSHMLDVELFGLRPSGHHLIGVLLHALNAVLFFLALRSLTGSNWASLLAAGLFALHPLRVESVAWASERKDVLSTSFWMLTLYAYAGFVRSRSPARFALVALSLGVGLMAKSMLVTLPCVLLLLDIWPLERFGHTPGKRSGFSLIREKWVLFALALGASVTTFLAQRLEGAVIDLTPLSLLSRCANAVRSLGIYLGQALWPRNLACFYPHPAGAGMDRLYDLWIPAGGAALALAALTALVLRLRRQAPYLLIGWLWYLGTTVPVIGLVQVGQQAHADRYTYVPMLGIAIAVAFGVADLARRYPRTRNAWVVGSCALLLGYAGLTHKQAAHWKDSRSLFAHAVRVTDRNFYALTFHGVTLRTAGEVEAAREELLKSLEIHPSLGRTYWELGLLERDLGRFERAVVELRKAVQLGPSDPRRRSDLAEVLMELGRFPEAKEELQAALGADPDHADSLLNLGGLAFNARELERAEECFLHALSARPDFAKAELELGRLYLFQGRKKQARPHLEEAKRLAPQLPGLAELLGILGS
jgi:tetratricopeptide (TPR) repeat protein